MLKILAIRDIKADVYGNPIFAQSVGGAIRSFGDEANKNDGNPIALHPDDFELYLLGEFDQDTAVFHIYDTKQRVSHASEFKRQG
jgi:hypothetical protein